MAMLPHDSNKLGLIPPLIAWWEIIAQRVNIIQNWKKPRKVPCHYCELNNKYLLDLSPQYVEHDLDKKESRGIEKLNRNEFN